MTVIVSGIYKAGKLELLETPQSLREGRVRVELTQEEEPLTVVAVVPEAQDDWERLVLGLGSDCGVSLPSTAFSSEELY